MDKFEKVEMEILHDRLVLQERQRRLEKSKAVVEELQKEFDRIVQRSKF
jgi:hypothetical protein